MSYLRRLSTRSLVVVVVAVLALAGGGAAIAIAAGGGGPAPPPKPLDQAIHDALAANPPDGVTARIKFTNRLFPSGALLGQVGSALMSGASGRLWLTNYGRGRIELQSDAGDVQIVWNKGTVSVYDASSNTVYRASLPPQHGSAHDNGAPTVAQIDDVLAKLGLHWAFSAAEPTDVAGRAAYAVSASPKHDGGLLGSLRLAWDAAQGVPLRAGVYAQGSAAPVLELRVTNISFGAVPSGDVDVAPPAGAKVVDLGSGTESHAGEHSHTPAVTGLAAVQAAAGFPVVAPGSLVGLPRKDVRLVGGKTALVFYGKGLGGIALVERKAEPSGSGKQLMTGLPSVSLDGLTAHELATQLGTAITWSSGGTSYLLAGSLPPAAAEAAARAVK